MAKCRVSYTDGRGVEHIAEVSADSLFEAAALALEAFSGTLKLTESQAGLATTLEVAVQTPPVTHRLRVQQLRQWLNGGAKSPREILLKKRLKELIGE